MLPRRGLRPLAPAAPSRWPRGGLAPGRGLLSGPRAAASLSLSAGLRVANRTGSGPGWTKVTFCSAHWPGHGASGTVRRPVPTGST